MSEDNMFLFAHLHAPEFQHFFLSVTMNKCLRNDLETGLPFHYILAMVQNYYASSSLPACERSKNMRLILFSHKSGQAYNIS